MADLLGIYVIAVHGIAVLSYGAQDNHASSASTDIIGNHWDIEYKLGDDISVDSVPVHIEVFHCNVVQKDVLVSMSISIDVIADACEFTRFWLFA